MEHVSPQPRSWNDLPDELKLHIAYHVATPGPHSADSSELTERPRNLPIDLSLRGSDTLSRAIALESIAKTHAFVKVMSYECGVGNACQNVILKELEDAFRPPKTNQLLSEMHENGHVRLSVVTVDLACPNRRHENGTGPAKLAAFFEINHYRTILLCNLLQTWEPFHVLIDLQTLHKGIGKQVCQLLDGMRDAVTDKQITFDTQLEGNLITPGPWSRMEEQIQSASMSTSKQILAFVRANTKSLQALLDAGHPVHHLVPLAMSFFEANVMKTRGLLLSFQQDGTGNMGTVKHLLNNYRYVILAGLSGYLLGQPLTAEKQKHYLFTSRYHVWVLRIFLESSTSYHYNHLVQGSFPDGQPLSQADLKYLRSRSPLVRMRAQFYLALARMKLLPHFTMPDELMSTGQVDNHVEGNLARAIQEMNKIECILQNAKSQENECPRAIWLKQMRDLAV